MFSINLVLLSLLGIFAAAVFSLRTDTSVPTSPANSSGPLDQALLAANITNVFDHQPDNETLASFSESGECMAYLGRFLTDYPEQWNRNKSLVSCQNYCGKNPLSDGYGVGLSLFFAWTLLLICGILTFSWVVRRTQCYQACSA